MRNIPLLKQNHQNSPGEEAGEISRIISDEPFKIPNFSRGNTKKPLNRSWCSFYLNSGSWTFMGTVCLIFQTFQNLNFYISIFLWDKFFFTKYTLEIKLVKGKGNKRRRRIAKWGEENKINFHLHIIRYDSEEIMMSKFHHKKAKFVVENITLYLNL